MNEDKLKRLVQSVGKRCFENCYEIARKKGDSLTLEDLIEHDPKLEGTAKTGLKTRLNAIKRIVRNNFADKAMHMAKNRRR